MKKTSTTSSLFLMVKEYLGNQFTRHPARCAEILHIMLKYQVHHIITRLGTLNPQKKRELLNESLQEHCLYAENLTRALEELGACFIKLGQVISTRPDLVPAPYISALSRLQHQVRPVPGGQIAEIIERDLAMPLADLFRSFESEPLAAASIAQVHRAVLHDGTQVVVKVQRPGVRQQVETDVEIMREVARFVSRHTPLGERYGLMPMVEEMERSLSQELDFLQEANNTRNVSQNIREFRRLLTPTIYPAYSSSSVLTLSFIAGRHLTGPACTELDQTAAMQNAQELLSAYLKQIVVNGVFHCDPHPGNILLASDGRLALLDFGMIGHLDEQQIDNIILLLLAFSERQGERVADIYLDMIELPERFDRRAFTREICGLVCRYHDMSKEGIEIGSALLDMVTIASAYRMGIPTNFALLGKTLLNLDGTLRMLSPALNLTQVTRHYMQQVVQQRALAQLSLARTFGSLADAKRMVEHMLRKSNVVLDRLAQDQFSTHVQVEQFETTIQRATQRLSLSMLLSSLMLSMALFLTFRRKRQV